jgi:hypothetical protein
MIARRAPQGGIKTPFGCAKLIVRLCLERGGVPEAVRMLRISLLRRPMRQANFLKKLFEPTLRFFAG